MNIWYRTTSLVLAVVAMVFFAACDQSEQNVGWEPGDELTVAATSAPVKMTLPTDTESTTAEFYNPVYTQNNNYTWEVSGPTDPEVNVRRGGEYIDIVTSTPGDYTITLNDDSEGFAGERTVDFQGSIVDELGLEGFGGLQGAVESITPVNDLLNTSGETDVTLLAPSDQALTDAGASGLSDAELERVLRFHAIAAPVASGDIADGQTVRTVLGPRLTFSVDSGTITVAGAADDDPITVATPDVPASNGIIHGIEGVLTPPPASATFDDQAAVAGGSGDTVTVAGAYLQDGGFIAMHEQDANGAAGAVVGNSAYLEAGFHQNITIVVDEITAETVLGAMPHMDDGDETYEFPILGQDGPYTLDGSAIIDFGVVTPPAE